MIGLQNVACKSQLDGSFGKSLRWNNDNSFLLFASGGKLLSDKNWNFHKYVKKWAKLWIEM